MDLLDSMLYVGAPYLAYSVIMLAVGRFLADRGYSITVCLVCAWLWPLTIVIKLGLEAWGMFWLVVSHQDEPRIPIAKVVKR